MQDKFMVEVLYSLKMGVANVYETKDYFVVQYICAAKTCCKKSGMYSIDKYFPKTKTRTLFIQDLRNSYLLPKSKRIKMKTYVRSYMN